MVGKGVCVFVVVGGGGGQWLNAGCEIKCVYERVSQQFLQLICSIKAFLVHK